MLALAACGGDDSGKGASSATTSKSATTAKSSSGSASSDAIAKAKNCDQLVQAATPVFTKLFQGLVDDVQKLNVADLAKLENPEESELFQKWTTQVEAETKSIEERSNKLNCSDDDSKKAVCDAAAAVQADNAIAEAMVKGMANEC